MLCVSSWATLRSKIVAPSLFLFDSIDTFQREPSQTESLILSLSTIIKNYVESERARRFYLE